MPDVDESGDEGTSITVTKGSLQTKRARTEKLSDSTNAMQSSPRKRPVVNYFIKDPPSLSKSKSKATMHQREESIESETDDEDDEDQDTYTVEAIMGHDFNKKGEMLFHIKWLGYDKPEDDSWEPEANLEGAREMVEEYLEKIGGRPEPEPPRKHGVALRRQKAKKVEDTTSDSIGKNRWANDDSSDLPLGSWETKIKEIKSISKTDQGKLLFTIEWADGQKDAAVEAQVLYSKAPQKALQFYESHIQFS
ncbi:uncharacterized protein V1513DRAFT_459693 [Lipomyces chichibuensis]|uniref:uncharacterized protein n=1 Tax=Lipomyces chichibuensis TaxID=1546026 RepID=UPI003343D59D